MRLILFDPSLRNLSGHHFNYALAIVEAGRRRGFSPFLFGNRQASEEAIARDLGAQPFFYWTGYDNLFPHLPSPNDLEHNALLFYLQLLQFPAHELREDDVLVFHSFRAEGIFGLSMWLERIKDEAAPHVALCFVHTDYADESPAESEARTGYYQAALARLAAYPADRLLCIGETDAMNADVAAMSGDRLTVLRAPHFMPPIADVPAKVDGGRLRIGYFGHSRDGDKGPWLIADIVAAVNERVGDRVEFRVQWDFANARFRSEGGREDLLSICGAPNVECIEGGMETERFYAELAQTDILLLPYSSHYRRRGSGLFFEGLVLGKVMVLPADSAVAEELARLGARAPTFRDWSAESIADAVVAAVERHGELVPAVRAAGERWRSDHDLDAFMTKLAAWVRDKTPITA